jgi:hypothetical protein
MSSPLRRVIEAIEFRKTMARDLEAQSYRKYDFRDSALREKRVELVTYLLEAERQWHIGNINVLESIGGKPLGALYRERMAKVFPKQARETVVSITSEDISEDWQDQLNARLFLAVRRLEALQDELPEFPLFKESDPTFPQWDNRLIALPLSILLFAVAVGLLWWGELINPNTLGGSLTMAAVMKRAVRALIAFSSVSFGALGWHVLYRGGIRGHAPQSYIREDALEALQRAAQFGGGAAIIYAIGVS